MKLYFIEKKNFWIIYGKPFGVYLNPEKIPVEDYRTVKREVRLHKVCVYFPKK